MSEDSLEESKTETEPTLSSGLDRVVEKERRDFLVGASAVAAGTLAMLAPIGAAVVSLLDPLRREKVSSEMVLVARTSAIPEDGSPRKFTVTADRTDAWAAHDDSPVGAVYLRRSGDEVRALNVVCPHAGCFVGVAKDNSRFSCPCHLSSFDLDGAVDDPTSPSPRDMDTLDVEVRNGDEVWVRFQNFLPGRAEKTPV
ncbi:MAG TPA: (2Fe-2S)-binding protein [Gemmatimonadetes bacterium]|nr:(2Fe-2S)-binding protein [Gemmatimonadota bacterium]